ncbi:helix-turn-helix domain-containing protein [Aestuariibaculum suncheonense]|uniref:Helix-turn-helix transcriptional regulator n=1 Tax=Aestuariibaculum suncheonense TaxID=1028745 RepID=A0A8J6Q4C1_9FLAO|nr:helix-turn-helix transcriptional regulator [Aestuariibaculum suncheonense]MBD0834131.1 helix-turn-helix transcriptional regulator [Aestuariibaculum suncheonense]
MKKYNSIGELFTDYREFNNLSQSDFAAELNVDLRTIQRWEKDLTLIKSEKEEDIVLSTLMPYQLIHNLNAAVPIPTFYDFNTRKYSLSSQSNTLPKLEWYLDQIDLESNNLRTIDFDFDIKHLEHFIDSQKKDNTYVNHDLIKEAIRLLPELNFVFTGKSGYYAGHCIVLPLKEEAYLKLKNREITNKHLRASDLINYKLSDRPIFYRYDITGDCNDSIFYVMAKFFRFFRTIENKNYLMVSYTERDDNYDLNLQIGLHIVWEDKALQEELHLDYPPRFLEGNFEAFLSKIE